MTAIHQALVAILATLIMTPSCGLAQDNDTGNLQTSVADRALGPERCAELEKRLKVATRRPASRAREAGMGAEAGRTLARNLAQSPEIVAYLTCLKGGS